MMLKDFFSFFSFSLYIQWNIIPNFLGMNYLMEPPQLIYLPSLSASLSCIGA